MPKSKTSILTPDQIRQKISRIAHQVNEDCAGEKNIVLAGIIGNGFLMAKRIRSELEKISKLKILLVEVEMDKKNPNGKKIMLKPSPGDLEGATIILVDDVLDSGRTMIYGLRPFLDQKVHKIRTVVLADRSHKRFPVSADFTGISIATTLQEHIQVVFGEEADSVILE